MLSKDGEIRRDESCVDYAGQEVMIFPCHSMKGNQEWTYKHDVKFTLFVKVTRNRFDLSKRVFIMKPICFNYICMLFYLWII